ncbi:MAG TPA: RNA 2',3'-cyclic phosphodiesterase [Gemmatimonadaceae bacterium]|nr:RNA 2',3'-cyclic phosphodiesterase [Gemmatimonadaceae bacterium]
MTVEGARPERLFIGVPVASDARAAIARALPKNLPGKLVAPDKWHFTLRFLGPTDRVAREEIIATLSAARLGPAFQVRFGELGAFPNPRRARILWLGVTQGGERLSDLAAIAEDAARNAGFAAEGKRFTPHLTLSRIDPPHNIAPLLAQKHSYNVEMTVPALILYRSRLGGGPARYEEVARFEL